MNWGGQAVRRVARRLGSALPSWSPTELTASAFVHRAAGKAGVCSSDTQLGPGLRGPAAPHSTHAGLSYPSHLSVLVTERLEPKRAPA